MPTRGILPPSLAMPRDGSAPSLQWSICGSAWETGWAQHGTPSARASPAETEKALSHSALLGPLLEYCAQLWPMLHRKGVGEGPEKGPRGDPRTEKAERWGKAESPGFVQPREKKNIITIFWGGY